MARLRRRRDRLVSVAFVASQDGGLTELGWLKAEGKLVALLHAERYLL